MRHNLTPCRQLGDRSWVEAAMWPGVLQIKRHVPWVFVIKRKREAFYFSIKEYTCMHDFAICHWQNESGLKWMKGNCRRVHSACDVGAVACDVDLTSFLFWKHFTTLVGLRETTSYRSLITFFPFPLYSSYLRSFVICVKTVNRCSRVFSKKSPSLQSLLQKVQYIYI